MKVLGLDTATTACSAALYADGRILARRFEIMVRGQSEALMPMVEQVLTEADFEVPELDLIAVTVGPGAFTGLRIGIAAARGLSLASGVQAVGISTTRAVAFGALSVVDEKAALLVALESKREDIYMQAFRPGKGGLDKDWAFAPAEAISPAGLESRIHEFGISGTLSVVGDAAERAIAGIAGCNARMIDAPGEADAGHVAAYAAQCWSPDAPFSDLSPLYLRPPDAVIPKNGGRLRA